MRDAASLGRPAGPIVKLGLKENWPQFALLVLINGFVGGMVGIERTVVPLIGAEEFGIALCLMLLTLFAFIVIRSLWHAQRNEDPFNRFAASGLAILFGLQSAINMAVNLHLMPAKGMTLPFVSYGGSSMISLAYGMGMLLAMTRERPRAEFLAQRSMSFARSGA